MPQTWQKALEMWDAGEPVPAFQVESEGATQERLWGLAFDWLRGTKPQDVSDLTDRECAVIDSIVHVANLVPWPQMVNSHVNANSPALTIRKPSLPA